MSEPAPDQASPTLSARLGYQLKTAHLALTDTVNRAIGPLGIEARDLAVLAVLAAEPPMSQADASRRAGQDRTTMVATTDRLESLGLVERRQDANDRRRNALSLTRRGREVYKKGEAARSAAETELLAGLSETDIAAFRRVLGVIGERAQAPSTARHEGNEARASRTTRSR